MGRGMFRDRFLLLGLLLLVGDISFIERIERLIWLGNRSRTSWYKYSIFTLASICQQKRCEA
jgi:hypothetical protein